MIINIKNGFSSGHLMQEKSKDMWSFLVELILTTVLGYVPQVT